MFGRITRNITSGINSTFGNTARAGRDFFNRAGETLGSVAMAPTTVAAGFVSGARNTGSTARAQIMGAPQSASKGAQGILPEVGGTISFGGDAAVKWLIGAAVAVGIILLAFFGFGSTKKRR